MTLWTRAETQVTPEPAFLPTRPPEIAGGIVLGALRWLAGAREEVELRNLYRALPAREQWTFGEVRVDGWYALAAWERMLCACDRELGAGDLGLCQAMGRGAAARSLARLHVQPETTPPPLPSPYALLARALRRWRSESCSAGSWVVTLESPGGAVARLYDLEPGSGFGRFLCGWLEAHLPPAGSAASRDVWQVRLGTPGEYLLLPVLGG